ncbi:hypothetical protein ALC57_12986 [Trachymyrmex cornetzi]|uniref:Uncharacterized protein n=1 Tax=Trachymyrmex cornetzi TaxID=471704 RepID=A0A195DPZ5_9HYME|nr:hypothetical protein ALC57_12986 [Trachymyrmex cornetzi]
MFASTSVRSSVFVSLSLRELRRACGSTRRHPRRHVANAAASPRRKRCHFTDAHGTLRHVEKIRLATVFCRFKCDNFNVTCQARAWASGRPIRLGSSCPGRACWEFNASRRQPVARDRTRFHLEDYGSPGRTGCRRSDTVGPVLDPLLINARACLYRRCSGIGRTPW